MSDKDKSSLSREVTSSFVPKTPAHSYLDDYEVVLSTDDRVYLHNTVEDHEPLHGVGTPPANAILWRQAQQKGTLLRPADLRDINDLLTANAVMENQARRIYLCVGPIDNGIEVDLGDGDNTRVQVTDQGVSLLKTGSRNLFYRSKNSMPYPYPAEEGDLDRLDRYLGNLHLIDRLLLKIWLAYTLAHPKVSSTNYVILVFLGGQGSGKTVLSRLIGALIGPSRVGTQVMPRNQRDQVVAALNSHVLFYDNLRDLNQSQSDTLCVLATGGYLGGRQLYTDGEQYVIPLHAALVLNGIHDFITESDLAQRCLTLRLGDMDESQRISEKQLETELERDLPVIFRGLLDLISGTFANLPDAEVTNPERMIDFVHWIAAKERIDGVPPGTYQALYSDNLKQGQLDSIMDDVLGEAIMMFADGLKEEWQGEPLQLLIRLSETAPIPNQRSSDWPKTATAMSRRLRALKAGLRSHGIHLTFGRDQKRWIRIETDKTESRF